MLLFLFSAFASKQSVFFLAAKGTVPEKNLFALQGMGRLFDVLQNYVVVASRKYLLLQSVMKNGGNVKSHRSAGGRCTLDGRKWGIQGSVREPQGSG